MRKNAIIGLILGVVIGLATVAYSDSINISMSGVIIVPDSLATIEVLGMTQNPDGSYLLPPLTMTNKEETINFQLRNAGSTDTTLTITIDGPPELAIAATYDRYILQEQPQDWKASFVLGRGTDANIAIVFQDNGLQPGEHPVTVQIQATT